MSNLRKPWSVLEDDIIITKYDSPDLNQLLNRNTSAIKARIRKLQPKIDKRNKEYDEAYNTFIRLEKDNKVLLINQFLLSIVIFLLLYILYEHNQFLCFK